MKRTAPFTMIEIALAMGVIVIGVVSVLGLFPVGLNASRSAIAESYACEAADQFLHFLEYRVRSDANGWTTWVWDDSANALGYIPDQASMGSQDVNPSVAGDGMWGEGILHDTGAGDDGIYKAVTYVDVDNSGNLSADDIRDFEGILAVWQEDLVVGESSVPRSTAVALKVEISWPAQAPYNNRERAVYHYELFNR